MSNDGHMYVIAGFANLTGFPSGCPDRGKRVEGNFGGLYIFWK